MPSGRGRFAADDWGLSPAVNEAILELSEAGLIRSVSLFANLPYTELSLARLKATGVELAAHVNFTLGRPLTAGLRTVCSNDGGFFPFSAFVRRGLCRQLDPEELAAESLAQLERLVSLCAVTSVNGHQHVHALPWMITPISRACRKTGISRIRKMVDHSHPASALVGRWAEGLYRQALPGVAWEPTAYLWPTGKRTTVQIREKLRRTGDLPILIHPAKSDDFASLEFSDGLRAPRVGEFFRLRELIS